MFCKYKGFPLALLFDPCISSVPQRTETREQRGKNKCLESIIKWSTSLLGNKLFIIYLEKNCVSVNICSGGKGIGNREKKSAIRED